MAVIRSDRKREHKCTGKVQECGSYVDSQVVEEGKPLGEVDEETTYLLSDLFVGVILSIKRGTRGVSGRLKQSKTASEPEKGIRSMHAQGHNRVVVVVEENKLRLIGAGRANSLTSG